MESKLTLEVNINLKADESLQQIVAYVFGQKLTPEHEKQPAAVEPKPQPQPAADPEPQPVADPEPQPAAETEVKPKRARSKKADPEPQPATEQPATEQPATEQPATEQQPAAEVSFEKVRQAFFQKLAGHRDEIRAKINELGAPSLSTMEPAKFPEMLNFLNNLD